MCGIKWYDSYLNGLMILLLSIITKFSSYIGIIYWQTFSHTLIMEGEQEVYTYSNACHPYSFGAHGRSVFKLGNIKILDMINKKKQHLRDVDIPLHRRFSSCPVIECVDKDDVEKTTVYINAYGLRQSVYLQMKNPDFVLHTKEILSLVNHMRQHKYDIVDAKMVYKTPLLNACCGERFFLKLYTGGAVSWTKFRQTIQTDRKLSLYFYPEIHSVGMTTDTKLFLNRRAYRQGQLFIPKQVECQIDRGKYKEINIFYKDIKFDNAEDAGVEVTNHQRLHEQLMSSIYATTHDSRFNTSPYTLGIVCEADFFRSPPVSQGLVWNWLETKSRYHSSIFQSILNADDYRFKSLLLGVIYLQHKNKEIKEIPSEAILDARRDIIRMAYAVKIQLKKIWLDAILEQNKDPRTAYKEQLAKDVSTKMSWLVFDVETDYKPHEHKEESLTCISTALFDNVQGVIEYILFVRTAETRIFEEERLQAERVSSKRVIDLCVKQLTNPNVSHFMKTMKFNLGSLSIRRFCSEYDMLHDCLEYIQSKKISYIAGFNINKFDLPFLERRYVKLFRNNKRIGQTIGKERSTFELAFTHKPDDGFIRYRAKGKSATRNKNSEENRKRTYDTVIKEEEPQDQEYMDCLMYDDSQTYAADAPEIESIANYKNIIGIDMSNIGVVDVMLYVGTPLRGCKLDDICKEKFNITKIHDERVQYNKLKDTWQYGSTNDLEVMLAYCLVDTILVYALIEHERLDSFHMAMSMLTGLTQRELYRRTSMPQALAIFYKVGYTQNIVLPDSAISRDDSYMNVRGFVYDNENDFKNLKSPAGRTVKNDGVYPGFTVVLDFISQYPCIMSGRNICMSTLLTEQAIAKNNYKIDQDYHVIPLKNVYTPSFCRGERRKESSYVSQNAFFISEKRYKAIASTTSEILMEQRKIYKEKLAKATNSELKDLYDSQQRAVKVLCNMVYGVLLRLCSVVGASITHKARSDLLNSATRIYNQFGYKVVSGDTDSIFVPLTPPHCDKLSEICRHLKLPPKSTINEISKALFLSANDMVDMINIGDKKRGLKPVFPRPSKLCVEKIFWTLVLMGKKNYFAWKVSEPNFEPELHLAGITGKKKDASIIKAITQFACSKMIQRKDIDGLIAFMTDIFELVSNEIRIEEIIESRERALCDAQDRTQLQEFLQHKEQLRKEMGGGYIPLKYLTGLEKVGEFTVERPAVTSAKYYCYKHGLTFDKAPMFIEIVRNSSVQISTFLLNLADKLQLGLNSDKESCAKKIRLSRLDITTMPAELIVEQEYRMQINTLQIQRIQALEKRIKLYERAVAKERLNKFDKNHLLITSSDSKKQMQERSLSCVLEYIDNYHKDEYCPPLAIYDEEYVINTVQELVDGTYLPHDKTAVNLRSIAIDAGSKRWLCVSSVDHPYKTVAIEFTEETPSSTVKSFKHTDLSWKKENMVIIKDEIIALDMQEYESQTRTVPFLVETFTGDILLINQDSYITNSLNAFAFRTGTKIALRKMYFEFCLLGKCGNKLIRFAAISNQEVLCELVCKNKLTVYASVKLPVLAIVRDDTDEKMDTKWASRQDNVYIIWDQYAEMCKIFQSKRKIYEQTNIIFDKTHQKVYISGYPHCLDIVDDHE